VDLGWVPSGVFDTLGVDALRALTAPLLIDSYVLEQAVIDDGMTTEMLPALESVGVVGLGVLADGLRKPIGVDRPIVSPADWRGISFGTSTSDSQADAIRVLGATPVAAFGPGLEDGTVQGFEFFLYNYSRDGSLMALAPYATPNVNLWPQMDVLLANPARLAALGEEQRAWLLEASRDAAARSGELSNLDSWALAVGCASGARFAEASVADLGGLEAALRPVYADLERDPVTKAFIARIRALKQSLPPASPLAIPQGCAGEAPVRSPNAAGPSADETATAPADLTGTYRYELTLEDAIAHDPDQPGLDEFPSVITVTLDDGRFTMNDGGLTGTYTLAGDRITFHIVEFETSFTFTFSVDDEGSLHLTPVPPMDPGDAFTFSAKPWKRVR
jgi:TRAP-type C4-dicarboxylate transport system substrate-binding protein